MQIKINLKIFFFIAIFFITKQLEIYGLLMLFAFFHELGHLLAGLFLGFRPKSLSINPLGLSVNFKIKVGDYNSKIKNGNKLALKKIIIAFSGPAVNFFIVIIALVFKFNMFGTNYLYIIYSNILIGIFNLIPIYPLDGGQILKNILHITKGLENSYNIVNSISNISIVILTILGSISILYLKNISVIFIVIYLWCLVINENKLYNQRIRAFRIIQNKDKIEI